MVYCGLILFAVKLGEELTPFDLVTLYRTQFENFSRDLRRYFNTQFALDSTGTGYSFNECTNFRYRPLDFGTAITLAVKICTNGTAYDYDRNRNPK